VLSVALFSLIPRSTKNVIGLSASEPTNHNSIQWRRKHVKSVCVCVCVWVSLCGHVCVCVCVGVGKGVAPIPSPMVYTYLLGSCHFACWFN